MVANATMQRARMAIDNFSVFFTPFHMLAFGSMVLLVCDNEDIQTMARRCLALL
jgi:hypothetical protein